MKKISNKFNSRTAIENSNKHGSQRTANHNISHRRPYLRCYNRIKVLSIDQHAASTACEAQQRRGFVISMNIFV